MKKILSLLTIVFLITIPMVALTQPAPPSIDAAIPAAPALPPGPEIDIGAATEGLMTGINTSQVTLIIGAGLMICVFLLRKFVWKKLQDKTEWLPWLAVGIATLGTTGTALVVNPVLWLDAVLAGLQAGVGASGTWGLMKKFTRKKKPA
jgi:hypothetical protein